MKFKRNLMFIVAFAAFVSSAFCISTTVNADSQNNGVVVNNQNNSSEKSTEQDTQTLDLSNYKNALPVLTNSVNSQLNTRYGDLGISKMWRSGGSIWFSLKATNIKLAVYYWNGSVVLHYYGHRSRRIPVQGTGYIGETWTYHVPYHKGWHGYAVLVGTIDGAEGTIKFPTCAF